MYYNVVCIVPGGSPRRCVLLLRYGYYCFIIIELSYVIIILGGSPRRCLIYIYIYAYIYMRIYVYIYIYNVIYYSTLIKHV